MAGSTGKAFDFKMFKRLLTYANKYKFTFYFVAIAAVLLSFFGVLRPYLLQVTIDDGIVPRDTDTLIFYIGIMGAVLLLEVVFQFCFIYFANLLGQDVIRDLRIELFEHMLEFKMKYFDRSAVGKLVTRAVSDIEPLPASSVRVSSLLLATC